MQEEYKTVFSQVHTTINVEAEVIQKMNILHKTVRRVTACAIVAGILLVCSVTAFSMNLFGLKDLVIQNSVDAEYTESEEQDLPQQPLQMISLQGYSDTDEYKAVSEWTAFLNNYDQDQAIVSQIGNNPTGFEEKYGMYLVYTQEMADKLDEITSRYHLKLHQSMIIIEDREDLFGKAGSGDFLGTANTPNSVYMYEDGTFHIDGEAVLQSGLQIDYQLMNCKKGSFTDTILNIGNRQNYTEWVYNTQSGVSVSLSIGPDKALVITDLKDSFMTINVLAGTQTGFLDDSGKITAQDLEEFADTFDFSALC